MVIYTSLANRPTIKVSDKVNFLNLQGSGGDIVCFIGKSPNTVTAPAIKKYYDYESVSKTTADGGLVKDGDTSENNLLNVIHDFFEEVQPQTSGDLGVPYIYAVDLGTSTITADTIKSIIKLTATCKDITAVCFTDPITTDNMDVAVQADTEIKNNLSPKGQPRYVYFPTTKGLSDAELIKLTTDETKKIQSDYICIIENIYYGKVVGKIATTPYYVEPGRDAFRTIKAGTFTRRSDEQLTALQNAGIIVCEDDPYRVDDNGEPLPVILIGVSTGFAATNKTTGCLLHARRNNNHQIREIMKILGTQLKENETIDALTKFKLSISNYLEAEEKANHIQDGYEFNVYERDVDPYNLVIDMTIAGVNATYLIEYNNEIGMPTANVTGQ